MSQGVSGALQKVSEDFRFMGVPRGFRIIYAIKFKMRFKRFLGYLKLVTRISRTFQWNSVALRGISEALEWVFSVVSGVF